VLIKNLEKIDPINAEEGTLIHQIFHPHDTLCGIRYSIIHSTILPGKKSSLHKMKSSEVYFILQGNGRLHVDEESQKVTKNQAIYIPPLSKQYLENTGNIYLKFLCIVDPAWRKEDEEILEEFSKISGF